MLRSKGSSGELVAAGLGTHEGATRKIPKQRVLKEHALLSLRRRSSVALSSYYYSSTSTKDPSSLDQPQPNQEDKDEKEDQDEKEVEGSSHPSSRGLDLGVHISSCVYQVNKLCCPLGGESSPQHCVKEEKEEKEEGKKVFDVLLTHIDFLHHPLSKSDEGRRWSRYETQPPTISVDDSTNPRLSVFVQFSASFLAKKVHDYMAEEFTDYYHQLIAERFRRLDNEEARLAVAPGSDREEKKHATSSFSRKNGVDKNRKLTTLPEFLDFFLIDVPELLNQKNNNKKIKDENLHNHHRGGGGGLLDYAAVLLDCGPYIAFRMDAPANFPFEAPLVRCCTTFSSPSVADGRQLLYDILGSYWSPATTLMDVIYLIPKFVCKTLLWSHVLGGFGTLQGFWLHTINLDNFLQEGGGSSDQGGEQVVMKNDVDSKTIVLPCYRDDEPPFFERISSTIREDATRSNRKLDAREETSRGYIVRYKPPRFAILSEGIICIVELLPIDPEIADYIPLSYWMIPSEQEERLNEKRERWCSKVVGVPLWCSVIQWNHLCLLSSISIKKKSVPHEMEKCFGLILKFEVATNALNNLARPNEKTLKKNSLVQHTSSTPLKIVEQCATDLGVAHDNSCKSCAESTFTITTRTSPPHHTLNSPPPPPHHHHGGFSLGDLLINSAKHMEEAVTAGNRPRTDSHHQYHGWEHYVANSHTVELWLPQDQDVANCLGVIHRQAIKLGAKLVSCPKTSNIVSTTMSRRDHDESGGGTTSTTDDKDNNGLTAVDFGRDDLDTLQSSTNHHHHRLENFGSTEKILESKLDAVEKEIGCICSVLLNNDKEEQEGTEHHHELDTEHHHPDGDNSPGAIVISPKAVRKSQQLGSVNRLMELFKTRIELYAQLDGNTGVNSEIGKILTTTPPTANEQMELDNHRSFSNGIGESPPLTTGLAVTERHQTSSSKYDAAIKEMRAVLQHPNVLKILSFKGGPK